LYQHFGVPGATVFDRRDPASDEARSLLLSYYSKLRHPYLNTNVVILADLRQVKYHASGSSPRDARTRRPAAPTFDWTPARLPYDRHFSI
jgi:hypothetical protein